MKISTRNIRLYAQIVVIILSIKKTKKKEKV